MVGKLLSFQSGPFSWAIYVKLRECIYSIQTKHRENMSCIAHQAREIGNTKGMHCTAGTCTPVWSSLSQIPCKNHAVTLCQACRTVNWWCCQKGRRDWVILAPWVLQVLACLDSSQRMSHYKDLQGTSHSLKASGQQTCCMTLCQDCRTLCQSPLFMHLMMLSERAQRLGHPSALGSPSACMSWFITTHLPLQGTSHSLKASGQQRCCMTLCQDCRTLCQSPLFMHLMMLSERAQRLGHPSALGSPSACMSWFITTHLPLQGTSHSLKASGQQRCCMTLCQDCRTLRQSPLFMHLMMLSERAQRLGHPSALGSPSACMSWFTTTHLPLQGTSHSLKASGQQTCCMTLCQDCRTLCQSPLFMHLMMLSERAQRLGHPSALGSPSACMSWFTTTHLPLQGTSHSLKEIGQQRCCMTLCQDCRTLCQYPLFMHLMMLSERAQRLGHPSALGSPSACMSWFITTHLPLQGTSHSLKASGQQTCCMTLCQDCRTLCQSPLFMHLMMLSERAQRLGHPSALGSPSACMSWFITTHLPLQGTSHSIDPLGNP